MGIQDFFTWRSQALANTPAVDEDVPADVDEPPDHPAPRIYRAQPDFNKSTIRPNSDRKESLLTKALTQQPEVDMDRPEVRVAVDLSRRRSMMSNASIASTAELTSDGGLTSPARTNTPSPPLPSSYANFGPYAITQKKINLLEPMIANISAKGTTNAPELPISISPKQQVVEVQQPKKRCITFACGGRKDAAPKPKPEPVVVQNTTPPAIVEPPKRRPCTIKFACPGPKSKPEEKSKSESKAFKSTPPKSPVLQTLKPAETPRRASRSPSAARKSPRSNVPSRTHRDSNSNRRSSQSPVAIRAKPKYIVADENTLESSEATRFHEFASGQVEEDDWIRKGNDASKAKLTINDTLMKENAIRRLGNEAEEEALEEEEDDQDDDEDGENDSDDDNDEEDEDSLNGSDDQCSDEEVSDGNETDNEAGFADSDESDAEGEFAFWTPGRTLNHRNSAEASTYRASAHRTASTSSIDSLNHMSPPKEGRRIRRRPIKIRPGTPDLPDSTDFVCGTLDEDRPLEDAYVSCMEARKHAKHKLCPQDIDPSFPTSDPEEEEDEEDIVDTAKSSDEHVWLHGNFEDSDEERHGRRRSVTIRRKSPLHSPRKLHSPPPPTKRLHSPPPPKRLHSPPPTKQRLRSPPPRKLFNGQSPKRTRSPPPARTISSPAASPTSHTTVGAIGFAPLGSRPGLTHTKSLPRTPNAFCRQYHASRLEAANGIDSSTDAHVRGAIDIVRGLEQKRQRRKEKFHQKQGNRKGKDHSERRPQPGKGAERMRELGLLMAGNKTGVQNPYMMSA